MPKIALLSLCVAVIGCGSREKPAPSPPVNDQSVRNLEAENARLKAIVSERKEKTPTPKVKRPGDGRRVLDGLETLRVLGKRSLAKGDRIHFSDAMSFDVRDVSTDDILCLTISWEKDLVFIVPRSVVKDRVIAGLVRLPGDWEIARVEKGEGGRVTLYGLLPYSFPSKPGD